MSPARLVEIRTYAEALALQPFTNGWGCQRDLDDIVKALGELQDLQWSISAPPPKPQPKRATTVIAPKPKRSA